MKPSEVLVFIRGNGGNLSQENQETIRVALRVRNFLAHEFFHKYSPVMNAAQCKRVSSRLRGIDSDLKAPFEVLQPLRRKLEEQLDFSADRQIAREDFRKLVAKTFESFIDEL